VSTLPEPGMVVIGQLSTSPVSVFASCFTKASRTGLPPALAVDRESRYIYTSRSACFWTYPWACDADCNLNHEHRFLGEQQNKLIEFSAKRDSLAVPLRTWSTFCYRYWYIAQCVSKKETLEHYLFGSACVGTLGNAEVVCLYDCHWKEFKSVETESDADWATERYTKCTGMDPRVVSVILNVFPSLRRLVIFMERCPSELLGQPPNSRHCDRSASNKHYEENSSALRQSIQTYLSPQQTLDIVPCSCHSTDITTEEDDDAEAASHECADTCWCNMLRKP
jgi:hypothetical protein